MAQYVMSMLRVSKVVPPKRTIIKDISLSFFPGAKIGLLGLNGSGKSTVLRIMANADREYDGEVQHQPGVRIGYLPQEPELDPDKTVKEEVESGLGEIVEARQKLEQIYAAYAEPDADFDKLAEEQAKYEAVLAAAGSDVETQMEIAADALRLPPWDAKIGPLSGGEKRRVALCKLLLSKPDMLLLDEPTNHLDAESVDWLEQFLVRFPGTVVAVTHDRYFLDNAAEWILELDRGHGIPWKGNYSSWLDQKGERLRQEESQESARQKALATELEWVRGNPKARQAKSKARLARYEEMSSVEYQKRNETHEIFIPPGERLGDKVIEFHNVSKGFRRPPADRQPELQHSAGRHRRRDRPERCRQIDAVPDDSGQGHAGFGRNRGRPDGQDRRRRPDPRRSGWHEDGVRGGIGRRRHPDRRPFRNAQPRLYRSLQLQGR